MRKFEPVVGKEEFFTKPKRATSKSAGYDIVSPETYHIEPRAIVKIPTGIKACMEDDEYLDINIRSGLATKHGLGLVNSVGIIDADYYNNPDNDGEIIIGIINNGFKVATIKAGDRIAQGIFKKYLITDDDDAVGERKGGLGSTGK